MKNIAVICEYNPFHNGHLYQFRKIRDSFGDCRIISVMSGNFVQRGEPAVLDKYIRARLAVENGADLVLELTPPYCFAPAEIFARAGVYIADSVGVDALVFGSEFGDTGKLRNISENLSSETFSCALDAAVKENIHSEKSYIRIRSEVYENLFGGSLPDTPNDILALEYLSALRNTDIEPFAFERETGYSAGGAREAYFENDTEKLRSLVPENVFDLLMKDRDTAISRSAAFDKMIIYKLLSEDPGKQQFECEECPSSLIYRLYDAAINSTDLPDLVGQANSKKYTSSRIKRALLNLLFGVRKGSYASLPENTNLLAANGSGRSYLREISRSARINIMTKPTVSLCDELYSFASGAAASDAYRRSPYIE